MAVQRMPLPDNALLQVYNTPDHYTDCFVKDVPHAVNLVAFITAFYTTPLFRAERLILRLFARRPSTDADVAALAAGEADTFAAWTVEERGNNQLVLTDMSGHTRSWFMVTPQGAGTRLHFGSAVMDTDNRLMRLLMPFHKLYARALLWSASVD